MYGKISFDSIGLGLFSDNIFKEIMPVFGNIQGDRTDSLGSKS